MNSPARRNFIKTLGFAIAATPLLQLRAESAEPAMSARVDERDPTAQALGYRQNVADVDIGQYPRSAPQDGARPNCRDCALFQAKGSEQWAGCGIFPGKDVNAAGWCNAWAPRT